MRKPETNNKHHHYHAVLCQDTCSLLGKTDKFTQINRTKFLEYPVAKFNKKVGRKIESVPQETLNAFQKYHWPGNVRELENVIERGVIISRGGVLQVLDRFDTFSKAEEPAEVEIKALSMMEQDHILEVLKKTGWRIDGSKGAAIILGLNASTLRSRMRKYGIFRG